MKSSEPSGPSPPSMMLEQRANPSRKYHAASAKVQGFPEKLSHKCLITSLVCRQPAVPRPLQVRGSVCGASSCPCPLRRCRPASSRAPAPTATCLARRLWLLRTCVGGVGRRRAPRLAGQGAVGPAQQQLLGKHECAQRKRRLWRAVTSHSGEWDGPPRGPCACPWHDMNHNGRLSVLMTLCDSVWHARPRRDAAPPSLRAAPW